MHARLYDGSGAGRVHGEGEVVRSVMAPHREGVREVTPRTRQHGEDSLRPLGVPDLVEPGNGIEQGNEHGAEDLGLAVVGPPEVVDRPYDRGVDSAVIYYDPDLLPSGPDGEGPAPPGPPSMAAYRSVAALSLIHI